LEYDIKTQVPNFLQSFRLSVPDNELLFPADFRRCINHPATRNTYLVSGIRYPKTVAVSREASTRYRAEGKKMFWANWKSTKAATINRIFDCKFVFNLI